MLPFHLKTPRYGGKVKKEVSTKASLLDQQHPLRGGGPVQRAIESDLLKLQGTFEDRLKSLGTEDESHISRGSGFCAFKEVFSAAKVALLHTRFAPPRCDAGACAQLVDACCFSLLRRFFKNSSGSLSVNQGAYAIFLLYSLFEACPLPKEPENVREQIDCLPMALQDRDNVRLIYRRSYRDAIRIDQDHFLYMIQLRELALAEIARCEMALLKLKQCKLAADSCSNEDVTWSCTCAVSSDVVEVVSRLLPKLRFAAYTGPASLEGLAGHADYSFPPNSNSYEWLQRIQKEQAEDPQTNSSDSQFTASSEARALPVSDESSETLLSHLDDYLSKRQDIRLPAATTNMTNQSKRVREALLPMFNSSEILDSLASMRANRNEMGPPAKRRKTIQSPNLNDDDPISQNKKGDKDEETKEVAKNEDAATAKLNLPPNLTPAVLVSVQAAFKELTKRDEFSRLPSRSPIQPPLEATLASAADVSTLGETQEGSTVVSDAGRQALRDLLARGKKDFVVTTGTKADGGYSREDLAHTQGEDRGSTSDSVRGEVWERGETFLGSIPADSGDEQAFSSMEELLSDISSDEDRGPASVTNSTVGRTALRDLISLATGNKKQRKKTVSARRNRPAHEDASTTGQQGPVSVTNSTVGRAALRNLLSLAAQPVKTDEELSTRRSSRARSGKRTNRKPTKEYPSHSDRSHLKTVDRTTDASSSEFVSENREDVNDEESQFSATPSTAGQAALRNLLSLATEKTKPTKTRRKSYRQSKKKVDTTDDKSVAKSIEVNPFDDTPNNDDSRIPSAATKSPEKQNRKVAAEKTSENDVSASETTSHPSSNDSELSDMNSEDLSSSDEENASSSGQGRAALEELLARALRNGLG